MDAKVLKWVLGVMSVFLLLGLVFVAKHFWGSDKDRAYREGYMYRDGHYVKMQREQPNRRRYRDDDRDDDDRRRAYNGQQSNYFGRFFRGFRDGDDDD